MADGYVHYSNFSNIGFVTCVNTAPTVVTSVTIPTGYDGFVIVDGHIVGQSIGASNSYSIVVHALVLVNDGNLTAYDEEVKNFGGTGFVGEITVSGSSVQLSITAQANVHAFGKLTVSGVEQTVSPA